MEATHINGPEIVNSRYFAASRDRVFEAFSGPDELVKGRVLDKEEARVDEDVELRLRLAEGVEPQLIRHRGTVRVERQQLRVACGGDLVG